MLSQPYTLRHSDKSHLSCGILDSFHIFVNISHLCEVIGGRIDKGILITANHAAMQSLSCVLSSLVFVEDLVIWYRLVRSYR